MAPSSLSTREKLLRAALELFTAQGISGTTTRQIAELAAVNEVTLFRHFGHKYGLLQAMIESAVLPNQMGAGLRAAIGALDAQPEFSTALQGYATAWLETLAAAPELVRSIIGEAGQFPPENRRVLGQGLAVIHQDLARQLQTLPNPTSLEPEALAGLLLSVLLGYAVVEFTCEGHPVWVNRNSFLADLARLCSAPSHQPQTLPTVPEGEVTTRVDDLPAPLVHQILQSARKCGLQDYALAYVLFGSGLSASELISLRRNQQLSVTRQQLLHITEDLAAGHVARQVPVNQWILGQHFGSPTSNPLSRWLRNRKDQQTAMFIDSTSEPLTLEQLQALWQTWTTGLVAPTGQPPSLAQAQQTWLVEMLSRGMSLENLSLLTGLRSEQLQPYARRAQEILALEQAAQLDRKVGK